MDSDYYSQTPSHSSSLAHTTVRAGTITSIQMINFMCHDNLKVILNPLINFVIGKNGSGKSAVQTAIAVGLGGKAVSTNRGSSIKGLIKNDKNTATIKICIANEGPLAYRQSDFGNNIQVERSFSKTSSSGYKIRRGTSGKVVTTEKKELDKILAHLNIQVQNPVCILHQDVARNFLNSSDPKNLYAFFLRASRFDDIERLYKVIYSRLDLVRINIDRKFEVVKEAFQDVIEMEKKLKTLKDAKKKEKLKEKLENELIWARVHELNLELGKLMEQKDNEEQKKGKVEKKMKEIDEHCLQDKIKKLEEGLVEKENKVKDARDKLRPSRVHYYEVKEKLSQCQAELADAEMGVKMAEMKCQSAADEVEHHTRDIPEEKARTEEIQAEITRYEEHIQSYEAAQANFDRDKRQLQDTIDDITDKLETLTTKSNRLKEQKRRSQEQIRAMEKSSSNISVYGNTMERFTEEVKKAARQSRFKQKPIGPLGMHIKVRDQSWAGAVEGFLGRNLLSSFCVDNTQDREILTQIKNSVFNRNGPSPQIMQGKFINNVHNTASNQTGTRQYQNLLQMLEIDNPVVANCLIDQQEIETVLLIPTNDEAYRTLDQQSKVPRNCKRAFTKTGDQFYPAPDYKSYSNTNPLNATLLQADKRDIIGELKKQELQLSQEITTVEGEVNDLKQRKNDTFVLMKKNELEQRKLKSKLYNLEHKCTELKETLVENNERNTAYFVEELNELKQHLKTEKEKLTSLQEQRNVLQEEMEEVTEAHEALKTTLAESDREKAPIQVEIQNLKSTLRQASTKADMLRRSLKEHDDNIVKLTQDIEELQEQKDENTEKASQICAMVETTRATEEINKELGRIIQYLKRIEEENGGTLQQLEASYNERRVIFDTVVDDLELVRHLAKKTNVALKDRKKREANLRFFLSNSAKHNFQMFLSERNFDGKLEFDLEAGTLSIKVKPRNDKSGVNLQKLDTASLSGGEKSFSTVCFIMALWQEVDVPFHFLDEFDVFMDGVNRRIVMDLLLTCAKHMKQQFVFLTPLDTSGVKPSDSITVHRLEAPRQ